jgi:hypothetical protein
MRDMSDMKGRASHGMRDMSDMKGRASHAPPDSAVGDAPSLAHPDALSAGFLKLLNCAKLAAAGFACRRIHTRTGASIVAAGEEEGGGGVV